MTIQTYDLRKKIFKVRIFSINKFNENRVKNLMADKSMFNLDIN